MDINILGIGAVIGATVVAGTNLYIFQQNRKRDESKERLQNLYYPLYAMTVKNKKHFAFLKMRPDEEFEKFLSIHNPDPEYVIAIKNFVKAYITDSEVREIMKEKEYARFATNPIKDDFQALTPEWRHIVPEYVKDYVPMNTYM